MIGRRRLISEKRLTSRADSLDNTTNTYDDQSVTNWEVMQKSASYRETLQFIRLFHRQMFDESRQNCRK